MLMSMLLLLLLLSFQLELPVVPLLQVHHVVVQKAQDPDEMVGSGAGIRLGGHSHQLERHGLLQQAAG
uniref:Putative secreted protein n=1 Tax=Anopheles marajoara TaxID=58244 RepID=A0A2M4CFE6_9DIPT